MATTGSYPEKNSLEVELYASRRGRKKYLRRFFFILKSLDSDNLWKRLKERMEALSSYCSLEHISLKGRRTNQDKDPQSACSKRETV